MQIVKGAAPVFVCALAFSCSRDLGISTALFVCNSSTDCSRGKVCDSDVALCVDRLGEVAPTCGNGRVEGAEQCDTGQEEEACKGCRVGFRWDCTREIGAESTCAPRPFVGLSAGSNAICGILADGKIACTGDDTNQRGVHTGQTMPPPGSFDRIGLGALHACARRTDRALFCWGSNDDDPNRGAEPQFRNQAIVPADLGTVEAFCAGNFHSCGVVDRRPRCWGWDVPSQPPAGLELTQIACGMHFTCGIDLAGNLECWGNNSDGRATPPAGAAHAVSTGWFHACAIMEARHLECWGLDDMGGRTRPPRGDDFKALSCSWNHCCALHEDGRPECWGQAGGDGERKAFYEYVPIDERFEDVTSGDDFSCGIRADRSISCFGRERASFEIVGRR